MRLILCYEKVGPMAFVAHLDFQQLWWRIFRLAGLSLEQTQGYNPRPKLRFALPLATGFQGENELLEVFLQEEKEGVVERLNEVAPKGLSVLASTIVPSTFPKVTSLVDALAYQVQLPYVPDNLQCNLKEAGEYLLSAELSGNELSLLLRVDNQKTVRPDVVASACCLGYDAPSFPITRKGIFSYKNEIISPWPAGLFCLTSK